VSDTPILDAAIREGCNAEVSGNISRCWFPDCADACDVATTSLAALRAALPWDLPAERLEAMARTYNPTSWAKIDQWKSIRPHDASALLANCLEFAVDAYRADPIMRELYPEQFR
jgi:hypothetical protein